MYKQILLITVDITIMRKIKSFDPELKLTNINPVIKSKLKYLLNKLKKFKVQGILVLDYKKRNYCNC